MLVLLCVFTVVSWLNGWVALVHQCRFRLASWAPQRGSGVLHNLSFFLYFIFLSLLAHSHTHSSLFCAPTFLFFCLFFPPSLVYRGTRMSLSFSVEAKESKQHKERPQGQEKVFHQYLSLSRSLSLFSWPWRSWAHAMFRKHFEK